MFDHMNHNIGFFPFYHITNMFSAGGFHKFSPWDKFASNPKFKIVLKDRDKDGYCTTIVSLMTETQDLKTNGIDSTTKM